MLRTKMVIALLLSTFAFSCNRHAAAQEGAEQLEPSIPDFLKVAPRELLRQGLKPLATELPDTQARDGLLPPDASEGLFGERLAGKDRGDQWVPIDFHWAPSCNRHRPTYFEDTMLERHGQSRHPLVQPAASGVRFFTTIAALPYAAVVNPPCRPVSTLGHFRAGSGAPCLLQRPPLQADAGLLEAGLIVGLIFIVP